MIKRKTNQGTNYEKKYQQFYVYEIRNNGKTVATYCLEKDAIEHVAQYGGEIYTLKAI